MKRPVKITLTVQKQLKLKKNYGPPFGCRSALVLMDLIIVERPFFLQNYMRKTNVWYLGVEKFTLAVSDYRDLNPNSTKNYEKCQLL